MICKPCSRYVPSLFFCTPTRPFTPLYRCLGVTVPRIVNTVSDQTQWQTKFSLPKLQPTQQPRLPYLVHQPRLPEPYHHLFNIRHRRKWHRQLHTHKLIDQVLLPRPKSVRLPYLHHHERQCPVWSHSNHLSIINPSLRDPETIQPRRLRVRGGLVRK
jgi:hypothetical protein